MKSLILGALLIHAVPDRPVCPSPPERVFLGAVATNVIGYLDRVVEMCGVVGRVGESDLRERVIYDKDSYSGETDAFNVFDPDGLLPAPGTRACVVGTPRRRDGLTLDEAIRRGLPNRFQIHFALHEPDYVFYPVQCAQDAPARG